MGPAERKKFFRGWREGVNGIRGWLSWGYEWPGVFEGLKKEVLLMSKRCPVGSQRCPVGSQRGPVGSRGGPDGSQRSPEKQLPGPEECRMGNAEWKRRNEEGNMGRELRMHESIS